MPAKYIRTISKKYHAIFWCLLVSAGTFYPSLATGFDTNSSAVLFEINKPLSKINKTGVGNRQSLQPNVRALKHAKLPNAAPLVAAPIISYPTPQVYTLNTTIPNLSPINTGGAVTSVKGYGQITTLSGNLTSFGIANGDLASAVYNVVKAVAFDPSGNMFIADQTNNVIRKITPDGTVSTFAGTGQPGQNDGPGNMATFRLPQGVISDAQGYIYVTDTENNKIRKISPTGLVTTFAGSGSYSAADGIGVAAGFRRPSGITIDVSGNLFVTESNGHSIRKITPGGVVTTLAGGSQGSTNGVGINASFNNPGGIAIDASGNLYVADRSNYLIRKITPAGVVTTLAGSGQSAFADGVGTAASFSDPVALAIDNSGNLYVTDATDKLIRLVSPTGVVSRFAGDNTCCNLSATDGVGDKATFYNPNSIAFDNNNNLFIGDANLLRGAEVSGYKIDKDLPAGLVFNNKTGVISGTPTALSLPTDYIITAFNAGGSSSTMINITVVAIASPTPPPMIAYATPNVYLINKAITALQPVSTGGLVTDYTIDKTLPSGLSFDASTGIISGTPTVEFGPETYVITARNAAGSTTATVSIQVLDTAITFGPLTTKTVCDTDFDPGATSKILPITYSSSNSSVAIIINNKIHILGAGNTIIYADNGYDNKTQVLTVTVPPNPTVTLITTSNSYCEGSTVIYTAVTQFAGTNPVFNWKVNGTDTNFHGSSYSDNNLANGDIITCIVTNTSFCTPLSSSPVTTTANIITKAAIGVDIYASINGALCPGTNVTFTATPRNVSSNVIYQWQVNGQNAGTNGDIFTSSDLQNGDIVTCSIETSEPCLVSNVAFSNPIEITILAQNYCVLNIPNTFTPNGDGYNDTWAVTFPNGYANVTLTVFNRLGTVVYRSIGYNTPWDGTHNGKMIASGTYYYIIEDKQKKSTGSVYYYKIVSAFELQAHTSQTKN